MNEDDTQPDPPRPGEIDREAETAADAVPSARSREPEAVKTATDADFDVIFFRVGVG